MRILLLVLAAWAAWAADPAASATSGAVPAGNGAVKVGANPSAVAFFESRIRPLFAEHCFACHGNGKHYGGLSMDSLEGLLAGGDEGVVLVPGEPERGTLLPALRWAGDSDLNMPPKYRLPEADVAAVERWVAIGAPWPAQEAMVHAAPAAPRPPLLGRLHPLIVHLPIGALLVAAFAEVLLALRGAGWSAAVVAASAAAALGGLVAVASGIAGEGGQAPDLLERHELMGWATLVLALVAAALALWRHRRPGGRWPLRTVLATALAAMAITGHLGGAMVYGRGWPW